MNKYIIILSLVIVCMFALNTEAQKIREIGVSNSHYPTLKAAFDDINAGNITAAITLKTTSNITETATAELFASGTDSAFYSPVIIYPAGTYTISGNLAKPIVNLKDADNVIFEDRLNQTGFAKNLTIVNENTGVPAIQFINDATNNLIKYCAVQGVTISATSGVIVLGSISDGANYITDSTYNLTSTANNIGQILLV